MVVSNWMRISAVGVFRSVRDKDRGRLPQARRHVESHVGSETLRFAAYGISGSCEVSRPGALPGKLLVKYLPVQLTADLIHTHTARSGFSGHGCAAVCELGIHIVKVGPPFCFCLAPKIAAITEIQCFHQF